MVGGVFLTLAASVLCWLPQPAPHAEAAKQTPVAPAPPSISWHTTGEITVPFEYFKQHIYVTLSLDDKPGFIFMLDSGTNRNILNLRTARELGIDAGPVKQERNIGFGDAPIYIAPQETLNAGIDSLAVAHAMAVMDLTRLEQHLGHTTDGMLGYPFFEHFVVKLDFRKKLLSISSSGGRPYRYRGQGVQVKLKPSKNFAIMPVTLGGDMHIRHQVDVAVDTGSDETLTLYEQFVDALDLDDSLHDAIPTVAFGLNGYYPVALGGIDSFLVGDVETRDLPVDYLTKAEEVGSEPGLVGAIGMGVLRGFRVVIFDVPHRRMVFEIKPPPPTLGTVQRITPDPH